MDNESSNPNPQQDGGLLESRWLGIALVVVIGLLLAKTYAPLLIWLGHTSIGTAQLNTGGLLVLFAIVVSLRDTIGKQRIELNISNHGLILLMVGFGCIWLAHRIPQAALPLVLLSFCLSFAGVISFLFGKIGVRQFMPALAGFLVFGLLVGLFPKLDWPLREIAAKYSGSVLTWLHVPVQIASVPSRPPEILLAVKDRIYVVATECNGFGLLTSSLLLATILAFQYRLAAIRKLGLFAVAIPTAIIFNFLRIVGICLVVPRVNLSYKVIHEGVGTVFYLLGLGLIWYMAGREADKKDVVETDHEAVTAPSSREHRLESATK